jgi:predicted Zn-dependent protease with MMP-like domain
MITILDTLGLLHQLAEDDHYDQLPPELRNELEKFSLTLNEKTKKIKEMLDQLTRYDIVGEYSDAYIAEDGEGDYFNRNQVITLLTSKEMLGELGIC